MRWWIWALICWAAVLTVWIVIAAAIPKKWDLPRDARDPGSLLKQQCDDDKQLDALGMLLTKRRKDQCETPRYDSIIVEPQNTWSNFAYLAAGLFILFRRPTLLGIAVGVNLCMLFLFSAWYHASLQPIPQAFDVGWIYAVILALIAYAIEAMVARYGDRHFRSPIAIPLAVIPFAAGIIASVLKANDSLPIDSTTTTLVLLGVLLTPFGLVLIDGLWLGLFPAFKENLRGRERMGVPQRIGFSFYAGMPTILCAIFRFGDGCGNYACNPSGFFQAHAGWHLFGSLALFMTYDFFAEAANSQDTVLVV